jgi:hypothetical protein
VTAQVVTLLLPMQSEKQDSDPSSIVSTYKQIFQVVKLPSVMRLALLLVLCKVRPCTTRQRRASAPFYLMLNVTSAGGNECRRLVDCSGPAGSTPPLSTSQRLTVSLSRQNQIHSSFRLEGSARIPSRKSRLHSFRSKLHSRFWWDVSLTSSGR